jgi:hypothetical protein
VRIFLCYGFWLCLILRYSGSRERKHIFVVIGVLVIWLVLFEVVRLWFLVPYLFILFKVIQFSIFYKFFLIFFTFYFNNSIF